jgi:hypothetical protein
MAAEVILTLASGTQIPLPPLPARTTTAASVVQLLQAALQERCDTRAAKRIQVRDCLNSGLCACS